MRRCPSSSRRASRRCPNGVGRSAPSSALYQKIGERILWFSNSTRAYGHRESQNDGGTSKRVFKVLYMRPRAVGPKLAALQRCYLTYSTSNGSNARACPARVAKERERTDADGKKREEAGSAVTRTGELRTWAALPGAQRNNQLIRIGSKFLRLPLSDCAAAARDNVLSASFVLSFTKSTDPFRETLCGRVRCWAMFSLVKIRKKLVAHFKQNIGILKFRQFREYPQRKNCSGCIFAVFGNFGSTSGRTARI